MRTIGFKERKWKSIKRKSAIWKERQNLSIFPDNLTEREEYEGRLEAAT